MPDALVQVELDDGIAYLWQWFVELHSGRTCSEFGQSPLSYSDIGSWCAMNSIRLDTFELRAIKALDAAYLGRKHVN